MFDGSKIFLLAKLKDSLEENQALILVDSGPLTLRNIHSILGKTTVRLEKQNDIYPINSPLFHYL